VRTPRLTVALLIIGGLAVETPDLVAQTGRMHIGPHLGYNFDAEAVALGGQFSVPVASRLEFYPSFDYYFVDTGSLWGLNADLKYRVARTGHLNWLYLASGLNLTRTSVGSAANTDAGLNLVGGAESLRGAIHPFAEARLILGDGSTFQLVGGLNLTLGRH
jgi:hypothetical protein